MDPTVAERETHTQSKQEEHAYEGLIMTTGNPAYGQLSHHSGLLLPQVPDILAASVTNSKDEEGVYEVIQETESHV